jgi:hypothetical protein
MKKGRAEFAQAPFFIFADGRSNAAVPDVQPPLAPDSALETVLNIVDKEFPIAVNAPIAATDTKAAIRPYSIAVAPDSSLAKVRMTLNMIAISFTWANHKARSIRSSRGRFKKELIYLIRTIIYH